MMHSTPASSLLTDILKRTGPRIEPWGTSLVIGCQPDIASFSTTFWALPFSQLFTQCTTNPIIPQFDNLSRRILWGTVSKALLKSRKTASTTFPPFTRKLFDFLYVGWTIPEVGGGDSWKSIISPISIFFLQMASQRVLSSRSMKKPKSALLQSSVSLFSGSRIPSFHGCCSQGCPTLPIPILVGKYEVQCEENDCPHQLFNQLSQEIILNALQKTPALQMQIIVTACKKFLC